MQTNKHCAKCGKLEQEHAWAVSPTKEHNTWKLTDKLSIMRALRSKQNRMRYPGRPIVIYCLKYNGICFERNECFALVNPRGGEFGWGECVFSKNIECCHYDETVKEWVIDMAKYDEGINRIKGLVKP